MQRKLSIRILVEKLILPIICQPILHSNAVIRLCTRLTSNAGKKSFLKLSGDCQVIRSYRITRTVFTSNALNSSAILFFVFRRLPIFSSSIFVSSAFLNARLHVSVHRVAVRLLS